MTSRICRAAWPEAAGDTFPFLTCSAFLEARGIMRRVPSWYGGDVLKLLGRGLDLWLMRGGSCGLP
ncbi:hypothetical protein [Shimia sp. R9_3]|uniref:hypothetical protein n=1 Tax=Shimia sp. R9_3 TaxID=2821113 RepID=UPI001AD9DD83|nr:hypothetical protein [Shimia sp. R9_3]MBO9402715.1 hypothetical protein [Shimia sp. R9_3]